MIVILTKIEINNYKSCDKTALSVNPNLTSLIGINGSGKTSILSAIKLLKSITKDRFFYREIQSESLFVTIIVATFQGDGHDIDLKATFNYDIGNHTEEEISSIITEWRSSKLLQKRWLEIPIDLIQHYQDDNIWRLPYMSSRRSIEKFAANRRKLPREFMDSVIKILNYIESISYYSATQFSDPQKSPTSVELEERENLPKFRIPQRHGPHTSFVLDLVKLKRETPKEYERYLNMIGPKGIGLIDDMAFEEVEFSSEEINVKSGGKIVTDKRKKLIIVPKITIGKKTLSFNQLSEGTFKTIALLFYTIQKNNALLLIEEPEVCVHHGLLRSVITVIKNESQQKQIIISTHSDFVLDQLLPENLTIVSRSNEKGTIAKNLSKSLSRNDYKALHAYLNEVGNLGEFWKEGGFDE
jgi:predicted ATP-dependent endonuclease of OLD family